jgi:hypothetical protein
MTKEKRKKELSFVADAALLDLEVALDNAYEDWSSFKRSYTKKFYDIVDPVTGKKIDKTIFVREFVIVCKKSYEHRRINVLVLQFDKKTHELVRDRQPIDIEVAFDFYIEVLLLQKLEPCNLLRYPKFFQKLSGTDGFVTLINK